MIVLSIFLEFSLNFLCNNLRNTTKFGTVRTEKRYHNLNSQKHSLKGQSGTKFPVKPTWSEKMIVLSRFLESSLNFSSNNLRNTTKFGTVRTEKRCQHLNWHKHSLKGQSETKSPVKPTWTKKMIVLSIFLESTLNFPSNSPRNTTNFDIVREKSDVKV